MNRRRGERKTDEVDCNFRQRVACFALTEA
jgi:hypothetical protein